MSSTLYLDNWAKRNLTIVSKIFILAQADLKHLQKPKSIGKEINRDSFKDYDPKGDKIYIILKVAYLHWKDESIGESCTPVKVNNQ